MGDEHTGIARCHSRDRDETDESGDVDIPQLEPGEKESADERQGNVAEHLDGEDGSSEIAIKQEGNDDKDEHGEQPDALCGLALGLKFALDAEPITLGQVHLSADLAVESRDER